MAKLEMTKSGEGAKEGPNKALLIILGVLCAVALFMFVVKPLVFSGDKEPSGGSPEASSPAQTDAQTDSGAGSGTDSGTGAGAATTTPGSTTGEGGGTTESPAGPAAGAGSSVEAAAAELPAAFAGKGAREDPFLSLAPDTATGSESSTSP
ncbi:MAG: hypothetical protein IT198_06245 [Acidimicrobiia bacterium]|nr:hypothetical protein [Acidimicrobiia bacterium]